MKFVDSCEITLLAGKGGNGSIAFRREKFVPFGGPSGGDGGRGGDIVFLTDPGMSTLLDLTHALQLRGADGENGMGSDCYGRGGEGSRPARASRDAGRRCRVRASFLFDLATPNVRTVVASAEAKAGAGTFTSPPPTIARRDAPSPAIRATSARSASSSK